MTREAHIPTKQQEKKTRAWLSCAHEDSRRPGGPEPSPRERKKAARGIGRDPMPARRVRQRLCRTDRLRRKKDFDRVFRQRNMARSRSFRLHFLSEEPSRRPQVRVAFVAGKRIGGAVVRNRLKRLMREAYRRLKQDLVVANSLDLVLVAGRDFTRSRSHEIEAEMRELFRRIGLIADGATGEAGD